MTGWNEAHPPNGSVRFYVSASRPDEARVIAACMRADYERRHTGIRLNFESVRLQFERDCYVIIYYVTPR